MSKTCQPELSEYSRHAGSAYWEKIAQFRLSDFPGGGRHG